MKPWYRVLLYLFSIPRDLLASIALLSLWVFFGTNLKIEKFGNSSPVLAMDLKKDSWPKRTWYKKWGATTLGPHVIMYSEGKRESTQLHEHVHVEQQEAYNLVAFIVCIVTYLVFNNVLFSLVSWSLLGFVVYLSSVFTAVLRGEKPYRGSNLEEAAYSIEGHNG